MKNIPLEDAIELLLDHTTAIKDTEKVDLLEAEGRILAKDILAPLSQPPFDRSPLDGYALKGEDTQGATQETPIALNVIEEIHAGTVAQKELQPGQAIRIMTGAPMPAGSNCVIRQEDTDEEALQSGKVQIYKELKPYSNYCYAGEDYKEGDLLIKKGAKLSAYHIGLMASTGLVQVEVMRKPRIALLSTGDELLDPGQQLQPGKIYNSNLYTLAIRLKELGCQPIILGTTGDNVDKTAQLIKDVMDKVDMVMTTGGVSVGVKDILHPVVAELGAYRLFWRLQMKPGTPALASVYDSKLILSLSGNPSAACITFELLFRDLLAKMLGSEELKIREVQAKMADDFLKKSPNRRFIRAKYQDGEVSLFTKQHSSGVLGSMIGCNCLVDIEAGNPGLGAGSLVKVKVI